MAISIIIAIGIGIDDLGKYLQLLLQGKYLLLHSYVWYSRSKGTSPLCSSNHDDNIHGCKWKSYGLKYCPAHGGVAKHPPGLGMIRGTGDWVAGVEAVLFGVEESGCHLAFEWKDGVLSILSTSQGFFCEWKAPLISKSNMPAVNQHSIQLTAVTDLSCSKRRWERGLGSARSAMCCVGERKSLLIMSAGTAASLGLTPPHVPPRCLARRQGMTAPARGDSPSQGKLPSLSALPQLNLQISMWGAHASAWPREIRDGVSFVRSFLASTHWSEWLHKKSVILLLK